MDVDFGKGIVAIVDVAQQSDAWVLKNLHELGTEAAARNLEVPSFAGAVVVAETTALPFPEAPRINPDYLLGTLDAALATYGTQLDVVNATRASVKTSRGQKKPAQLEMAKSADIQAEVEALLANEAFMADLQAQADYFTAHPEQGRPAVGFDLRIIPEGLTNTDGEAVAKSVQAKIRTRFTDPYIRPSEYNDIRIPAVTGKGFYVVVVPHHYNVPKGTAGEQTNWAKTQNAQLSGSQLRTATDVEALAYIDGLAYTHQLDDPGSRFDTSYFRRFDQKPVVGIVSGVYVNGRGKLKLGGSDARVVCSTRALVEPKA